jgi:hypothetical protein
MSNQAVLIERADEWDRLYAQVDKVLDETAELSKFLIPITASSQTTKLGYHDSEVKTHVGKIYDQLWALRRLAAQEAYLLRRQSEGGRA